MERLDRYLRDEDADEGADGKVVLIKPEDIVVEEKQK